MKKLSRGTERLIKESIQLAKSNGLAFNDRYILCQTLCLLVEEKYSGSSLDYQLNRMNLTTTKLVLEAIDIFFYKNPKYLESVANDEENINYKESE